MFVILSILCCSNKFDWIIWFVCAANVKKEHLMELFQVAVARQTDIMVMNILGHGVDIPLLGLREACKELNNGELCELFTDESYAISQCFLMSTSQVCCTIKYHLTQLSC